MLNKAQADAMTVETTAFEIRDFGIFILESFRHKLQSKAQKKFHVPRSEYFSKWSELIVCPIRVSYVDLYQWIWIQVIYYCF